MDEHLRDTLAQSIRDWETKNPDDPDIRKFLNEMITQAINQTIVRNLGWSDDACLVYYDNQHIKDNMTGQMKIQISREKAAWSNYY